MGTIEVESVYNPGEELSTERIKPRVAVRTCRRRRRYRRAVRRADGCRRHRRARRCAVASCTSSNSFYAQGGRRRRARRGRRSEPARGRHPAHRPWHLQRAGRRRADARCAGAHRAPRRARGRRSTRASAARAGTRAAASCTPVARRPGAASPRCSSARAREHPRITIREGVRVLARLDRGRALRRGPDDKGGIRGRATLIATGGYAALWEPTTNPLGAIGEGIVMAYRAGAAVADLEFMQFHPTAVAGSGFLLSEALRGEGAVLRDDHGERFVDELAERDVVARAIAERGQVGLDLRAIERGRFSSLMATLERDGYDPATAPIPVSPAAHYSIGGIVTDIDGHTSVPGAVRRRRVQLHGRARREPPRLELAARVPRLRPACGARALGEPALGAIDAAPPAPEGAEQRGGDAARPPVDVAARGPDPERATGSSGCAIAPLLLARLLGESALARRRAAARTSARTTRSTTTPSRVTSSSASAARPGSRRGREPSTRPSPRRDRARGRARARRGRRGR